MKWNGNWLASPSKRRRRPTGGRRARPAASRRPAAARQALRRRRLQISSKVFGSGESIGFARPRDTSSNTSGVERVSYSGRITGPNYDGDGLRRSALRRRIDPRLEERVIRQDQIRERAGFVDERSEADDERHALQRVGDLPCRRRRKHRIHIVDQQHLRRARREQSPAAPGPGRRRHRLRHERHAARLTPTLPSSGSMR